MAISGQQPRASRTSENSVAPAMLCEGGSDADLLLASQVRQDVPGRRFAGLCEAPMDGCVADAKCRTGHGAKRRVCVCAAGVIGNGSVRALVRANSL